MNIIYKNQHLYLGLLFILHSATFLILQILNSWSIFILSMLASLACGLILIFISNFSSTSKKMSLYFVIARSMVGLITGLIFFLFSLLGNSNQINFTNVLIYNGLPCLLFLLAIGFSNDQLKKSAESSSITSHKGLLLFATIAVAITILFVFFLRSLGLK
jgi:hypothetical protein